MKSSLNIALLAGDDTIDFKVLYCLYRSFENIHIISNEESSILKHSFYKKNFKYIPWSASLEHQDENISEIKQYFDSHKIEFIMVGACDSIVFLDKFKGDFPDQAFFPPLDRQTLDQMDNKWKFAEILLKEGISTPKALYIETPEEFDQLDKETIESEIGFPLIAKPVLSDDGVNVCKIENYDQLKIHMAEMDPNILPLIIQDFVDGMDASFGFVALNGEVLSYCVKKFVREDVIEYYKDEDIEELSKKVVKLFNFNGPANLDIRIDKNTRKPYVLECNPRFWRSVNASMWCGLNYPALMIKKMIGEEYSPVRPMGEYTLSGRKVKDFVKKPWTYFTLSKAERKEIFYNLFDFLSHLAIRRKGSH